MPLIIMYGVNRDISCLFDHTIEHLFIGAQPSVEEVDKEKIDSVGLLRH